MFSRLVYMVLVLNVERVSEVLELPPPADAAARLTEAEIRKLLKRRVDLNPDEIDVLKF